MLLAPLNSGISVFLKKVRFSAVAFCLSSSLSLPQASFPHQDQTAFAFLSADSENREKKNKPCQCISLCRQHNVKLTPKHAFFPSIGYTVCYLTQWIPGFVVILHVYSVWSFCMIFLCFHQFPFLFSLYLISVSDCTHVTKIASVSKITKISLPTTVLSPV